MLVRSYNRNQQMSQRLHEEMSAMSTRNTVTELPNKALLLALLEQLTASDNKNALIVIASETLQDTAGVLNEEQREMLLLTLVEKIKGVLPPNMVLAQLSGNDFGIIAHGVQDAWQAMALAKQILAVLNEKLPIHSISLKPTASIGIAMYHGGLTAEQLYRRAVSAAFSARRHGKNQIQFFDPEQMAIAQRYLTQEQDLLTALENQQFAIWLQPQVNLRTREVVSAEVLLRMQQPDGSWGLPEGLIERIEDSGLMFTIGNWILEESCRVLAGWQSQGVTMPLCVNISAHQLLHEEMGSSLLELMARYRIQPGMLILEVTESHNIDDPKKAVSILRPLRKAGVRIALDDFGMGYASLRHLHHLKSLPVDVLKLDKSFVDGLPEDNTMAGVIIGMANTLGLKLVAEGIENQAQCDWLLNAGVSIAQGYLFSRALTLKEFDARYLSSANQ
jgi:EAL domain-containing protein (putative c-di-GMP-specific phosphodiesterase class I)/GGDEF domain-containing protein